MTWIQTASGRAVDLLNPMSEDIDFHVDIPEALARIARFTGHVRSGSYSVAQHSVLGADAVWRDTRRPEAALAFLLHDAKETYIGDMATPLKQAMIQKAGLIFGEASIGDLVAARRVIMDTLMALEDKFDRAIHEVAGLAWPLSPDLKRLVKDYDLRMLATERRFLLGPSPKPWAEAIETAQLIRFSKKFTIWPWPHAADEFRSRLADLCPRLFI